MLRRLRPLYQKATPETLPLRMFGLLRWRCGVYTALASVESYVKTYTPVGKKRRRLSDETSRPIIAIVSESQTTPTPEIRLELQA
ncbi:hypothetical protein N7516_001442 [Penicillium verrucosum]|uniref:uncharacterized protein n=1 Tax=Penicillium verrucosum TaxID=60171 RepID=UPI002544EDE3|nr:uncharacterized protein N7516_001442 [Penicillium verrucosum]KAJ5941274.1 hypothetical protein N7516_001442 [Penicillium verrucosum]